MCIFINLLLSNYNSLLKSVHKIPLHTCLCRVKSKFLLCLKMKLEESFQLLVFCIDHWDKWYMLFFLINITFSIYPSKRKKKKALKVFFFYALNTFFDEKCFIMVLSFFTYIFSFVLIVLSNHITFTCLDAKEFFLVLCLN